MKRRAGVTLMEVLVAIMICSIGLLALMTLFPLAAIEMAMSVKDDKMGHVKHNIGSSANLFGIRTDPILVNAMLNPGGGLPALNPNDPTQGTGPSYPIFVDPNGWNANIADPNWREWVGGWVVGQPIYTATPKRMCIRELNPLASPPADPNMTLANPQYVTQQLKRWCTSLDEINFRRDDETSLACACSPGLPVERGARYSYAWLLQMPKVRLPSQVNLTVVIYSGRPLDQPAMGETIYSAAFNPPASLITLSWGANQAPPEVGIGSWLFDGGMSPSPQGAFYRVVGVTQTSPTSIDCEVLTPPTHGGYGPVIVMENVVEVYFRGSL
jgi:hypothetical protein